MFILAAERPYDTDPDNVGGAMRKFTGFSDLAGYWADRDPEGTAFVTGSADTAGGKVEISYERFRRDVDLRSRELYTRRIRDDIHCEAILCDGSYECLREIFAAADAGVRSVLLNIRIPAGALPGLLKHVDADCLWAGKGGPDLESIRIADARAFSGVDEDVVSRFSHESDTPVIFFTSGTTSSGKAVVLTDRTLMSSAWNGGEMLPLKREDLLLSILPVDHVFGFVCGILWPLTFGCPVALGRGPLSVFSDFQYYRPSAVSLVPSMLSFFLEHNVFNDELKLVLIGAGSCKEKYIKKARDAGIMVSFGYGLTETSSGVAISTGGDPFAMDICPDDTIKIAGDGEILIKAPSCMMKGYYKEPEETEKVIVDGYLHSGDMGYLDDEGRLHISGRKKEMLVLEDGTKVFLPEYEEKLVNSLGNSEIAVLSVDDRLVMVYHREGPEAERPMDDLADEIMLRLKPVMETVPRDQRISQVILTDRPIPRTATGKIRRKKLLEEVRYDS